MSAFMVSKKHIDLLVQSALAGVTDLSGWNSPPDEHFDWHHDDRLHRLDQFAEVGDEKSPAIPGYNSIELVPPSVLGQRLVDQCARSVNHRYEDNDEDDLGTAPFPYVFEAATDGTMAIGARGLTATVAPLVSAAQLAKGIHCYEYQACEHPEWPESEAFAFCQALKERILHRLSGYDQAPWGW